MRGKIWNKMVGSQAIKAISLFDYQACLAEIRQLLVDLGVSEYGGANCISRLGHIVGSLADGNKENLIDIPNTVIMTREWKRNLHKQISVFRQIMLDVDRSFPSHKMFIEGTGEGKEGRATLFRVVAVYAMYNPQVSYCQVIFTGMSYNAGMLLMNMSEEDSFWCLVSMFERPKYLAGYFNDSLGKIQRHASVFEKLMQQRRPKLYKHLEVQGVSPLMYLTPWFMALFTSLPCWDAVLTIWDLLLSEGLSITFQVALALLDILSGSIIYTPSWREALRHCLMAQCIEALPNSTMH
ncbi:carabin-like [Stylophora pistillata]|uniref:carabin-like n=1 Tax=Stylophora pistillata TaxID=50429 RepID=UPI000C055ACD|nr:carabin-like [Stylophora pistillata]